MTHVLILILLGVSLHPQVLGLQSPVLSSRHPSSTSSSSRMSSTATTTNALPSIASSPLLPSSTSTWAPTPPTALLDQTTTHRSTLASQHTTATTTTTATAAAATQQRGFVDGALDAASSAASSVAGTAMNAMYDKPCVMCEYILEQVDKMIKAQPRMMNGNGYYPGVMDFGGGVQQGNYRVYQGTYLEESESSAAHKNTLFGGKKRLKTVRRTFNKNTKPTAAATATASTTATTALPKSSFDRSAIPRFGAHDGRKRDTRKTPTATTTTTTTTTSTSSPGKASAVHPNQNRFTLEQRKAAMARFQENLKTDRSSRSAARENLVVSKSLLFASQSTAAKKGGKGGTAKAGNAKAGKAGKGGSGGKTFGSSGGGRTKTVRARTGRHTFKDIDMTNDQIEKDQEFATMYKDFMDAMDDVCFHDFPKDYQQYCKYMYFYGDRVVEMYLHDYDDFEICAQTPMQCTPTWFDEGAKSMW